MKWLSVLLLSLLCGWGGKMQIIESTSQEWVGGLQESGYGTDFKLTIKVKAGSDLLQIDELWAGDIHMKLRMVGVAAASRDKAFNKGSQVTLMAGFTCRPGPDEKASLLNADTLKKPGNFKGEGLLGYTFKGKKSYMVIAEFKKLKKIIYP